MSAQDVKWIVIASSLLVSVSLWVGVHSPTPNQSNTRMASLLSSAPHAPSARPLTEAVAPAASDSWHSPAQLAWLKAESDRLDKEEKDMAKPVPYDASQGFDAQHLAPSSAVGSGGDSTHPDPNAVGYDYNSQVRAAGTGNGSPSNGDAESRDHSAGDRYFNPYDPANYYPPGYQPAGNGPPSSSSDNDNANSDNQEDINNYDHG